MAAKVQETENKKASKARNREGERGQWWPCETTDTELRELQNEGMISAHWSFIRDTVVPKPGAGEVVMTKAWVERIIIPCSEFSPSSIRTGLPHNICPNSYLLLSNFATLCEGHLGIRPDVKLWQFFFRVKKETKDKAMLNCGSMTFMLRPGRMYPPHDSHESVRYWNAGWFYEKNVSVPEIHDGLPKFNNEPPEELASWSFIPSLSLTPILEKAARRISWPYPSANGNGYGNSYGNSYNNNRSVPSGLEAMLKEFISTQTAFNKSVEEKLGKIDTIASRVDRLASDVNLLKLKVMPNNDIDNKITTTANAIQVRINENIRLMAELRARWDREENEKLAKENNVAKVWTITTTSNANSSHVAAPPTINGKIIGVGNVSTPSAKRTKLPEIAKTAETACDKTAEIFSNLGNNDPIAVAHNDLDFDDCHISEVIKFLQKLARSPNASAINLAFTKHITNALIKAREEKLKLETSIPRKLEDGWEPIIKMKFNDFECNALCDLGASISVMPKKIYDMLDLPPLKNCYLDVNLADNVKKKPLGRIDNVHIMVNNNLVPVDFVVLDIECNASCPIVLGRPFLRTVGAVIDMREGNIKYQFPLKKGMEHFPRKRMKLPFDSIIRTSNNVDASTLDVT
ncbi:hypothetical protein QYE76_015073 [Lolium multiflorum]|uniref:Transposase (putative) gypsy type domain-containing protein n=1 Tax=Lolium multiflorum TaxID=4521 RepID=A0AAD8U1W4_LOLMU|nr:hypothetical protein QYE76_015073 [Lolium multiflorum]